MPALFLHVAQRVTGHSAGPELRQHLDAAVDGAGHHFFVAFGPGVDHFGLARVLRGQFGACLSRRSAQVLLCVPGRGADMSQKVVHSGYVGAEELAVEMARVPVQ